MKGKRVKKRYVKASECSTIAMVTGNEKKFDCVVHNGLRKQWVGIDWVVERPASAGDYARLPIVKD